MAPWNGPKEQATDVVLRNVYVNEQDDLIHLVYYRPLAFAYRFSDHNSRSSLGHTVYAVRCAGLITRTD